MNDKKFFLGLIILTFAVITGGVFILSKNSSSQISATQNAKVEAAETKYDWGKIKYSGGNVNKTFTIKNGGSDTLALSEVKTSCACTKVQIKIEGGKSPYFGMHTVSSWIGKVPPGKEAQIDVIFDPAFHGPTGVGPMTRTVTIKTNDAVNPTLQLTLIGDVIND